MSEIEANWILVHHLHVQCEPREKQCLFLYELSSTASCLRCNGVARYIKLPLREMVINNIILIILLTIFLNIVILLDDPKVYSLLWNCVRPDPPIASRRAQWVVTRLHHTLSYMIIIKLGKVREWKKVDFNKWNTKFTFSTILIFTLVVYPSFEYCLITTGHWPSLLPVIVNSVLVAQ